MSSCASVRWSYSSLTSSLQCQKSCVAGAVTSARPARRARVHTCCFSAGTPVLAATRAFRSPMVSLYCTLADSAYQVTSVDSTVPRPPGTLPAHAPHIYRHGRVRLAGAQRDEDLSRATREQRSHFVVSKRVAASRCAASRWRAVPGSPPAKPSPRPWTPSLGRAAQALWSRRRRAEMSEEAEQVRTPANRPKGT